MSKRISTILIFILMTSNIYFFNRKEHWEKQADGWKENTFKTLETVLKCRTALMRAAENMVEEPKE